MPDKMVIVPQADIDLAEKSRIELYQALENGNLTLSVLLNITPNIWKLTHRRYEEFKNVK